MKQKHNIVNFLNNNSKPNQNLLNLISDDPSLQVQFVSVYDLVPNPQNFYKLNDIESLAAMIEMQGGVKIPLEVKKLPDDKYSIIAGHRRRAAVLLLLEKKSSVSPLVPVFIKHYETEEMETMALIFSNRGQRTRTPDEIMEEIQRLKPIARRIYDEEKAKGNVSGRFRKFFAEEILQISEASLQRKTQLTKLSGQAKEALDNGTITMTAASELSGLKPEQQDVVLKRVSNDNDSVTIKSIQQEKEHVKNAGQQETKPHPKSAAPDLRKTKAILVQYQKAIRNEFADILLHMDQSMEEKKKMDINKELSKLELLLASISGEVSRMK